MNERNNITSKRWMKIKINRTTKWIGNINLLIAILLNLHHKIYDSHDDLYDYDLEPKGRHYDQSSIQVGVIICLPIQSVQCFVDILYIYVQILSPYSFLLPFVCTYYTSLCFNIFRDDVSRAGADSFRLQVISCLR